MPKSPEANTVTPAPSSASLPRGGASGAPRPLGRGAEGSGHKGSNINIVCNINILRCRGCIWNQVENPQTKEILPSKIKNNHVNTSCASCRTCFQGCALMGHCDPTFQGYLHPPVTRHHRQHTVRRLPQTGPPESRGQCFIHSPRHRLLCSPAGSRTCTRRGDPGTREPEVASAPPELTDPLRSPGRRSVREGTSKCPLNSPWLV